MFEGDTIIAYAYFNRLYITDMCLVIEVDSTLQYKNCAKTWN